MAAIGLAASIISVIEITGTTLSYLNDVRTSSRERAKLAVEVSDVSARLVSLRYRLADSTATDPWFKAVQGLSGPLESFKATIKDLADLLTGKSGFGKIASSLTWTLDKRVTADYLAKIERLKTLIMLALQEDLSSLALAIKSDTAQITAIHTNLFSVSEGVRLLKLSEDKHRLRDIVTWLAPLDYMMTQQDILAKRYAGTGEWFLESSSFQKWMAERGATLWCPGIPGAGKTFMASLVIEWLQSKFKENNEARVTCAYCSYQDKESQNTFNLIAGLWRQLVQPDARLSGDVLQLYDEFLQDRKHPALEALMEVFRKEVYRHSRVYIVLDALDEFPENYRSDLIRRLRALQPTVNLLVTSRKLENIANDFLGELVLEITAAENDIVKYIQGRISDEPKLSNLLSSLPSLRADINSTILRRSKNMFLLSRLYMDSLLTQPTVKAFRKALVSLPSGLNATYDDALKRIENGGNVETALKILYWTACALRPLKLEELLHALAIEPDDHEFDEENVLLEDVTSLCAGLIEVDRTSRVVRLAHYTTQDYLENKGTQFYDFNKKLGLTCLVYLSFDGLIENPVKVNTTTLKTQYRFLSYAALYWGHHVKAASETGDEETQSKALALLDAQCRVSDLLVEEEMAPCFWGGNYHVAKSNGRLSSLHIAIFFDLVDITQRLAALGAVEMSREGYMICPLGWAAYLNRVEIAKILIDHHADVNGRGCYPWRPLHYAAIGGHAEMVDLLLRSSADVDIKVESILQGLEWHYADGQTPLHEACVWNRQEVATLLLDRGANIEATTTKTTRDPALIWAVRDGLTECFVLLVRRGASLVHKNLMELVIQTRSKKVLHELIAHGINLNQSCYKEKSALDFGLEIGDAEMVGLLVTSGALPRLPWDFLAPEVCCHRGEPWYEQLQKVLLRSEKLSPSGFGGHVSSVRKDILVVTEKSPDEPYVEVLVTANILQPVGRIIFRTTSHDQGWSDYHHNHGTFRGSATWFEAAIKNDDGMALDMPRRFIQHNIHASPEWKLFTNVWDRRTGEKELQAWLDCLTTGRTLQIFPKARYPGWENHVQMVQVDVYGMPSSDYESTTSVQLGQVQVQEV